MDRYRGAEILFDPSIVGHEKEGITDILEHTLDFFGRPQKEVSVTNFDEAARSEDLRQRLLSYVLLTGGNTQISGFDQRIKRELTMMNPQNMPINVVKAYDATLDAWKGGALLAQNCFKKGQL